MRHGTYLQKYVIPMKIGISCCWQRCRNKFSMTHSIPQSFTHSLIHSFTPSRIKKGPNFTAVAFLHIMKKIKKFILAPGFRPKRFLLFLHQFLQHFLHLLHLGLHLIIFFLLLFYNGLLFFYCLD